MFMLRLGLCLGKSLREVMQLDAREIQLWKTYDRIEPFGDERADLRVALNTSILANSNRSSNVPPFKTEDFMPFRRKPEMKPQEIMQTFASMFGVKPHGK